MPPLSHLNHKEASFQVSDGVGTPALAYLRGEILLVFRDLMGHLNLVHGFKGSWKHLNLSLYYSLENQIASWDPSISLVGLSSVRILWVSSGRLHKLSGTSPTSLQHVVL